MSNTLADLKSIFWNMSKMCLADIITEDQDRWIRKMYPKNGAPDWKVDDNIVFLNLDSRDDDYGKQWDTVYRNAPGTMLKKSRRTRVWDLSAVAYGPKAFEMATAMQDGVYRETVRAYLAKHNIYVVTYLQQPVQSNEIFAGQWWERWNVTLTFNERYDVAEDVSYYDQITIIPRSNPL